MNGTITSLLNRMFSLDGLVRKVAIEMPIFNGTYQEKVAGRKGATSRDEKQNVVKGADANYLLNEQDRKSWLQKGKEEAFHPFFFGTRRLFNLERYDDANLGARFRGP